VLGLRWWRTDEDARPLLERQVLRREAAGGAAGRAALARSGAGHRTVMPDRVREFLEAARLRGVRWTARALVRQLLFSYRQAYLFWSPLEETPDAGGPSLDHRPATRDDLDRLSVFEPYVGRGLMRRWLESEGTWVFLALDGDRPVAFLSNSTRPPSDPILPPLVLSQDQLWTNEVYVVPEYRRRHVSLGLRQHRNRLMRSLGFREVVSKVYADNQVSLKRMLKLLHPSARVRRVTCLRVLGLRWRWVDEDGRRLLEEHLARAERP
jgi:hypothetical protein